MSKPVLSYLGETKLALGPAENVEGHPWRRAEPDGIVWLVLDCADTSTNTISEVVLEGLNAEVEALEKSSPKAVVLRSAKKNGFAAGADINGFREMTGDGAVDMLRKGAEVLDRF